MARGFRIANSTSTNTPVKTLVMEDEHAKPPIVLAHGDRKVSTKELGARSAARRWNRALEVAFNRHTGFLVGGTSPFGTRKTMPVYIENRSSTRCRSTSTAADVRLSGRRCTHDRCACCNRRSWKQR